MGAFGRQTERQAPRVNVPAGALAKRPGAATGVGTRGCRRGRCILSETLSRPESCREASFPASAIRNALLRTFHWTHRIRTGRQFPGQRRPSIDHCFLRLRRAFGNGRIFVAWRPFHWPHWPDTFHWTDLQLFSKRKFLGQWSPFMDQYCGIHSLSSWLGGARDRYARA